MVVEPQYSGKSAKFTTTCKIPQNSLEILSNICLYNIFGTYLSHWGCLLAVSLQIYHENSSLKWAINVPKLPGTDYVAENWALAMMLFRLCHWFISGAYCCWKSKTMMTSAKKTLKTLVWLISSKICPEKIPTKSAVFYQLLFSKVCPKIPHETSYKIGSFFCKFVLYQPPIRNSVLLTGPGFNLGLLPFCTFLFPTLVPCSLFSVSVPHYMYQIGLSLVHVYCSVYWIWK